MRSARGDPGAPQRSTRLPLVVRPGRGATLVASATPLQTGQVDAATAGARPAGGRLDRAAGGARAGNAGKQWTATYGRCKILSLICAAGFAQMMQTVQIAGSASGYSDCADCDKSCPTKR